MNVLLLPTLNVFFEELLSLYIKRKFDMARQKISNKMNVFILRT